MILRPLMACLAALSAAAPAATTVTGALPRHAELGFATEESAARLIVRRPKAGIGLGDGDQIVAVDGRAFAHPYEGSALLQRVRGNSALRLTVRRGAATRDVRFHPRPAPLIETAGEDWDYGEVVASDGTRLRTIVSKPASLNTPAPALFFTQWVSCGSIERGSPVDQLRTLARDAGMVLLRVERSGVGDSLGPACHELDYDTEVRHYREAFEVLARHRWVDPRRIVIYGSSLGATTAPLVAAGHPVAGILVQGAGALTYAERMINFDRIGFERDGTSPPEIDRRMRQSVAFHAEYLLNGRSPEEIGRLHPELADFWSHVRGSGDGVHYGRPFAWHRQAARRDFVHAWSEVKAPVLVVYGEYDQYETRHGHELIAETVNRLRPGSAAFIEIPHADHELEIYPSAADALAYRNGQRRPELFLVPAAEWLRRVTGAAGPSAATPQAVSPTLDSYTRARALLDSAIAAIGGEEALRATRSVEREMVLNWVDVGQQLRPWHGSADLDRLPVGERIPMHLYVNYADGTLVREERYDEAPEDRFVQRDVIVGGDFFGTGAYHGEPPFLTVHAKDEIAGKRRSELRALPEALLLLALDRAPTLQWLGPDLISFADTDGQRITLSFDPATHLLARAEWLRDHAVLGDTTAGFAFTDYRPAGRLKLPFHYYSTTGGYPARDYRVSSIELDRAVAPEQLRKPGESVPVQDPPEEPVLRDSGGGVYEVLGPYNVMFAVFPRSVLLVEAPIGEPFMKKVLALIRGVAPGKPIELVSTHFHWDHVGGVRYAVAQGIPIWTTADAAETIRQALASRRTLQPDSYSAAPRPADIRIVHGRHVFADGGQRVEVYDVGPTDHVQHMLVALFARTGTLLAADLWDVPNAERPIPGNDAAMMMRRLAARGARVARMVPVHGVPANREALLEGFRTRWKYTPSPAERPIERALGRVR